MKRNVFGISRKDKILIYGYPKYDTTKELLYLMRVRNWNICGIIDRNALLYRPESIYPIWKLEEIPFSEAVCKTMVVIVLLQNGFLHTEIASALWEKGFERILFIPRDTSNAEKKKMCEKYNALLFKDFDALNEIPIADKVLFNETPDMSGLIRQGGAVYTVLIRTELLFSGCNDLKLKEQNIKYCTEYLELYDYLTGKKRTCQKYLWIIGIDKKQADVFLSDREKLYLHYEQKRTEGDSFFINNAPHAVWNEKGYFNIIDGHHRAVYLAYCGYRKIPVQITKKDYYKWRNSVKHNEKIFSNCAYVGMRNEIVIEFVYKYFCRSGRKIRFLDFTFTYAFFFQRCGWTESYILCDSRGKRKQCEQYSEIYHENIKTLTWDAVNQAEAECVYIDMTVEEEMSFQELLSKTDIKDIIVKAPLKKEEQIKNMFPDAGKKQELGFCHFEEESVFYYLQR